jgi:putative copper resistance protein D
MASMTRASTRWFAASIPLAAASGFLTAQTVLAHGPVPGGPPTALGLATDWTLEPAVVLPLVTAALAWVWAVRRIRARHPSNPVPPIRSAAFAAGLASIAIALLSGVDRYDTTLFSIHMVQHLLLTLVAAPLVALAAPITTLLRVASPNARRNVLLPILHSRVAKILGFPVVSWLVFAGVMWGTHFSPIFDRSLEDPLIHDLEHGLYLAAGLLFWWPAVGLDPSPWRIPHPVRAIYVFLQMPQNTFLAVAILYAPEPLYPHYATLVRGWGPTALQDQQLAGAAMWLGGDVLFLIAMGLIVAGWMRRESRDEVAADRRVEAERAAIRSREARLAERLADEREGR